MEMAEFSYFHILHCKCGMMQILLSVDRLVSGTILLRNEEYGFHLTSKKDSAQYGKCGFIGVVPW